MSIATSRRAAALLNVAAVVLVALAVHGYVRHRQSEWKRPDFRVAVAPVRHAPSRIDATYAPLGRFVGHIGTGVGAESTAVAPAGAPRLFADDEGAFRPTPEGVRYLEKHYAAVLKDAETRDTARGVVRIREGTAAAQFGLRRGDVIVAVNGRPVRGRADLVNAVRAELRRRAVPEVLRVTVERGGRSVERRYHTGDPELRRRARAYR